MASTVSKANGGGLGGAVGTIVALAVDYFVAPFIGEAYILLIVPVLGTVGAWLGSYVAAPNAPA